jgi:hypothetical protein
VIFGRPTNLWLGVVTSGAGVAGILLIAAGLDPTFVAQLLGAVVALLGALITLIAGQPPSVNAGDRITVHTPNGQPDATAKVGLSPSGQVAVIDRRAPTDG